ncbi:MAG TPA: allantoinase AllB [Vicinamibacterales bacterium]|nr:allantoinase AllB [Vicinamibacterales bacterium]
MSTCVIRSGLVVEPTGARLADVRIDGEQIVEVGDESSGADTDIDARGLVVMPGIVDVHVHFNEPGRTAWEGGATGSHALAAGGGTTFVDMPLNSTPCVVTAAEVDRKRLALEAVSLADFAIWGGLVPGHVDDLPAMAQRGVIGFKAFMCDSGLPEFPRADDETLRAGMIAARALGLPIAVHAESEALTRAAAALADGEDAAAFLASRPLAAELEAIARALALAEETGVALHIVHVSSGQGVALAAAARRRGVAVSIETCPHYLTFTTDDLDRLGVIAKCAPPFRDAAEREALWRALADGTIDLVASDHSPAPPSLKLAGQFRRSWGGIAGVQSTLAVLLDEGFHRRGVPLHRIAALVAATPAGRFRIGRKGAIAPGRDADLVLVDLAETHILRSEDLRQRHPSSPYVGQTFRGVVRRTIRRGETIFADGDVTVTRGGRFLRPDGNGAC